MPLRPHRTCISCTRSRRRYLVAPTASRQPTPCISAAIPLLPRHGYPSPCSSKSCHSWASAPSVHHPRLGSSTIAGAYPSAVYNSLLPPRLKVFFPTQSRVRYRRVHASNFCIDINQLLIPSVSAFPIDYLYMWLSI